MVTRVFDSEPSRPGIALPRSRFGAGLAGPLTVASLGEFGRRTRPDRVALSDGRMFLTNAELDRRVESFASGLLNQGVRKREVVAAYLPNRVEYILAVLGAARAGAVFLPINPRLTARELGDIFSAAMPALVFTTGERCPLVRAAAAGIARPSPRLITVEPEDGPDALGLRSFESGPARHMPDVDEADPFSLMFTSGTTGRPKGALGSHRARMVWILNAIALYGFGPDDVHLAALPLTHAAGLTFALMHLHLGARVEIMEAFTPANYLSRAATSQVTSAVVVPAILSVLVEELEAGRGLDAFGHLRCLVTCGSPLALSIKFKVFELISRDLYDYYGSTESSSMTMLPPKDQLRKPNSVGQPFPNVEIRVVRSGDVPAAANEVGEIWCRNPSIMTGYVGNDEATQAVMRDGWYVTGDLGYLDEDGFLHLAGRSRDLVVTGGYNVYPAEVERVVMQHSYVADCAVVGEPDPRWGEAVAACVVLRQSRSIDLAALQRHCAGLLADYKKPRRLYLLPSLPRNAAGKVMKAELKRLVSDGSEVALVAQWE